MAQPSLDNQLHQQHERLRQLGLNDDAKLLDEARTRLGDSKLNVLITGEFGRGKSTLINAILGQPILATSVLRMPTVNKIVFAKSREALAGKDGKLKQVDVSELPEGEYEYVELKWDEEPLKNVELIEYPSMTENSDEEKFKQAVHHADLVFVVVTSDSIYSKVEKDVIESIIRPAGHGAPFFIITNFDSVREKDVDSVLRSALTRLPVNEDHIFFVSSTGALDGDEAAQEAINQVRQLLIDSSERQESIKQDRAELLLKNSTEKGLEFVENMASDAKADAEKKAGQRKEIIKALQTLQRQNSRLQGELNEFRDATRDVVQGKIRTFTRDLALKVKDWGNVYNGSNLVDHLNQRLKQEVTLFSEDELRVFLQERIHDQKELLSTGVFKFKDNLNTLHNLLSAAAPDIDFQVTENPQVPTLNGFTISDKNGDTQASNTGFSFQRLMEVPESLIVLVATIASSVIFRQFWQYILPGGIGLSFFLAFNKLKGESDAVKQQRLNLYVSEIKSNARKLEISVAKTVSEELNGVLSDVELQLKEVMEQSEARAQSTVKQLQATDEDSLQGLKAELEKIHEQLNPVGK